MCVNGTGVTLASTNNGFPISSDDVSFTSTSASSSPSVGPGASATAKSGAGFVKARGVLSVAIVFVVAFL